MGLSSSSSVCKPFRHQLIVWMLSLERWIGRVCVVTGASAGIGRATTLMLIRNGMRVAGCGRSESRLSQVAEELEESQKDHFLPIRCDMADEAQVESLFSTVQDKWGGVDVLINNAGVGFEGTIIDGEFSDFRQTFEVNVLGLLQATQLALCDMRRRDVDDGHIINISSMSGHRVSRTMPVYSASKFAVRALTDALRLELRHRDPPSSIKVTEISPGLVETQFAISKYRGDSDRATMEYTNPCLSEAEVANAILYALSTPPSMDVNDILIRPTLQKG